MGKLANPMKKVKIPRRNRVNIFVSSKFILFFPYTVYSVEK